MKIVIFSLCLCLGSPSAWTQGLKKVDYQGAATPPSQAEATTPQLSPEQVKLMMDTVRKAKEAQEAQTKFLEELDAEE